MSMCGVNTSDLWKSGHNEPRQFLLLYDGYKNPVSYAEIFATLTIHYYLFVPKVA